MCNLTTIKKIIRFSSPIANINKIDLYVIDIKIHSIRSKMHLIYIVYLHLVFYLSKRHFNALRNILYMRKLAVSLLITANKSVMTRKRNLVTITPSIKFNQIINETYNAGSQSIKVLTTMKA